VTIKPIVVGTDGSPESIQAVGWAAREAQLHGTGLRIVSAAELLPPMFPLPQAADIEALGDALRRDQDRALSAAAKTAASSAPDVQVETARLDGAPALAVTDAGTDEFMLAVGATGGGAFAALGSVGRYAATHALCPVVVIREESMATRHRVVVGIRDAHDCDAALGFAFREASLRNASLVVVHAWHVPRVTEPPVAGYAPDSVSLPSADEVDENVARQLGEQLAAWSDKYAQVEVSQDVVNGHPGWVLAGMSGGADLVVLGRRRDGHRPGVGRVIHAVLAHAHGPVVVVPGRQG
jgi:nucleotide-binding universal stress UspA family protein